MFFSKNIDNINTSKTTEISDLVLSLKNRHNIINMASGELSIIPASQVRKEV